MGALITHELKVYAQRDRYVIVVLYPVWRVDRNMHTVSRPQTERLGPVLKFRPVAGCIVVCRPKALDFRLGQNLAIIFIKDVKGFLTLDLQDEIAFAIDMVRAQSARR